MTRKIWQRVSWPIVCAVLGAPFMANCGAMPGGAPGLPSVPGVTGACPDMAKVEAIESFDFEKEFKLKAEVAAKIKAGAEAAADMKAVADKIDADLKGACGNLAHDLGAAGEFKDGEEACKAAIKAIGDAKAKLGASAKLSLDVSEPHCGLDVNVYADCAGHCDASIKGGKAEVKCEGGQLQGECSGKCKGECELSAAASCSGSCDGTCDAEIKGTCSGKCDGKCDGKAMPASASGQCGGTCDGKCSGNVHAECKGKCGGSCKMSGQAECKGTCSGSCSVEMKAPKCTGKVEPPQMSAECKAKCDANAQAKAECTPPHVAVRVTGATDAATAMKLIAALDKDLGDILKVALGTGKGALALAGNMKVVIEGVQGSIQGAGDAMTVAKLTACVGAPFKGALDAVASVQANVKVSVDVHASASASGSAKSG